MDSKKSVVITGAKGKIGRVLAEGLKDEYRLTLLDQPEIDLRSFPATESAILRADPSVIIHLAWDTWSENWKSWRTDPGNTQMCENMYQLAKLYRARLIVASSVHVEKYRTWKQPFRISPYNDPMPDSPYGAHKIFLEKQGRWWADKGLEVICVRFGGVAERDKPWDDIPLVGLSHPDCVSMIEHCIEAREVPNNFSAFYAVSMNKNRIHDIVNPFGWWPKDDAAKWYDFSNYAGDPLMGL